MQQLISRAVCDMQTGDVVEMKTLMTQFLTARVQHVLTVESLWAFPKQVKVSEGCFLLRQPSSLPRVCRARESFTHCN